MLDPGKYYANNICATLCLIEVMHNYSVDKLVFSSTCATYGIPNTVPICEDAPQNPINPYGRSKLVVEQMLEDFDRAHGLKSIALRYFNAAGADPDGEIGECHDPETHLIPLALDVAEGRRGALVVNGDDYPTPDGTCIRDYVHVTDLADAHVRALGSLLAEGASRRLNLGTGNGASIRQVIDAIERVTGKSVPSSTGPRREGDPASLIADPSKARKELGWTPQYSDLNSIVGTAWTWHQKRNFG